MSQADTQELRRRSSSLIPRVGAADLIIQQLRHRIVSGQYPTATRLPSERELATEFGVSPPTIREAIRALTAARLLAVKRGSGTYVTSPSAALIATPLANVVQLQNVGVLDVMSLLRALDIRAAELATERATTPDIDRCRRAAVAVASSLTSSDLRFSAREFFASIADASHDPLGAALIKFIGPLVVDLQIKAQPEPDADAFWRTWAQNRSLSQARLELVRQMELRDRSAAAEAAATYHDKLLRRIQATPAIREMRIADLDLAELLASLEDDGTSI